MEITKKNSIKISKMTLGTVQLGMSYGVNNNQGMPTETESFRILDAAYDGGVTMLDTSDDYGTSEDVIGNYLKKNKDKHFEICTKFKVTEESSKDIYGSLRAFAEKSLKRLSIETIPVFMSHTEKNFLDYGDELVDALNRLKKDGTIISAGISLSDKSALEDIIKCGGFDAIQMPMNILDNKEIQSGLVKNMSDSGIAVFIRSVYLQGLFFRSKKDLETEMCGALKCAVPVVERLREIAADNGLTVAQMTMAFIRDTAGVDSLVVGSETEAQVKENVALFNIPKLSDELVNQLLCEFKDVDPFIISPWLWGKRAKELETK